MIQNAEDAGAKRIIFLVDHSTYGTDPNQLYDPRLASFQVWPYDKMFLSNQAYGAIKRTVGLLPSADSVSLLLLLKIIVDAPFMSPSERRIDATMPMLQIVNWVGTRQ